MAISFPNTFQTSSGNVAAKTLDDNFNYTTTLAANATVASSLSGSELILLSQGGLPYSATITSIVAAVGSGTATQANKLTTGRTISISGDVTYTSPSFDGTANVTNTATVISASTSTPGKVQLAQASDVTTATSTTLAVTPFSLSGLPNGVKAWVAFSGRTTNGASTILASYNVSAVNRTVAGGYSISFANALVDGNYAMVCSGSGNLNGSGGPTIVEAGSTNNGNTLQNTGSTAYLVGSNTGAAVDPAFVFCIFCR